MVPSSNKPLSEPILPQIDGGTCRHYPFPTPKELKEKGLSSDDFYKQITKYKLFNFIGQKISLSLVQIMLRYCLWDSWQQISVKLHQNIIFIQETAFENLFCKQEAISSQLQYANLQANSYHIPLSATPGNPTSVNSETSYKIIFEFAWKFRLETLV